MLFVTIGTDRGFDRFIKAIDKWSTKNKNVHIFAQIGRSNYEPKNFKFERFLDTENFRKKIEDCDTVIAHAGMGTVITTLTIGKPIIIFPRSPEFLETANSHQIDTANALRQMNLVKVAFNETELSDALSQRGESASITRLHNFASKSVTDTLSLQMDSLTSANRSIV